MAGRRESRSGNAATLGGASARTRHSSRVGQRLRRDALENQERVLAAAVAMFARQGREVSMAAIAAEAGVGIGTLYRRYPTREALLQALTERSFLLVLQAIRHAADADAPAIVAVEAFYDATIAHRHELVLPLHGGPTDLSETARATRQQIWDIAAALIARGHHDRTIRGDVTQSDLIGFGALLAQTLSPDAGWAGVLHRQKAIYLAGLSPHGRPLTERTV